MLGKAASNTIVLVFGMTRPGIEPQAPGSFFFNNKKQKWDSIILSLILYQTPTNWVSWVWHQNVSDGEVLILEFWGSMEYPFISITPRSTFSQSSSTCKDQIYGLDRSV